jgi:hypothetical protein
MNTLTPHIQAMADEFKRRQDRDHARRQVREGLAALIELNDFGWVDAILTVTQEQMPKRIT